MQSEWLSELTELWDSRAHREASREAEDPSKVVHTDLLFRMIRRHTPSAGCTILDAGAGTGRFSIPLAQMGHPVMHLDISGEMLRIAREEAARQQVVSIEFRQSSITDLSEFGDRRFDMTICLDAPLSFCGQEYPRALDELTRVCRSTIVLSVLNRTSSILTDGVNFDLTHFGGLRTVKGVYRTGTLEVTEELRKLRPSLMPSWHAFTPDELISELEKRGYGAKEVSATGTMTRCVDSELLDKIIGSSEYEEYLAFEEEFDSTTSLLGLGGLRGSGLTIAAERHRG